MGVLGCNVVQCSEMLDDIVHIRRLELVSLALTILDRENFLHQKSKARVKKGLKIWCNNKKITKKYTFFGVKYPPFDRE